MGASSGAALHLLRLPEGERDRWVREGRNQFHALDLRLGWFDLFAEWRMMEASALVVQGSPKEIASVCENLVDMVRQKW